MRLRIGLFTSATLLFLAGAVGLLGDWALATAVVLFVGTAVATVIVWEDREADHPELIPARISRQVPRGR
jgi:hypothetical protein